MQSNTRSDEAKATRAAAGSTVTAADELAELVGCVLQADRLLARAVELAGRLAGSGACEEREGLPLEHFVGLAARMTSADARMLVTAGEVLRDLPVVAGLFADGVLGWGQVRAIVLATKRLPRADRGVVDQRLAATVAQHDPGVEAFDPDGLVWAVDAAVDDLRPAAVARAERAAPQQAFLTRQMALDGWMRCYGELDPLSAAAVNSALDARMGRPPAGSGTDADAGERNGDPAGQDAGGGDGSWSPAPVGRAAAEALGGVCADWLGGDTGRPARPLLVAHVDVSQATAHPSGTVELNLRGALPRIGTATLERLAHDADLRAVLFDGARPLAASGKVRLDGIPRRTRLAVAARDRGCRFPGSQDPIGFTDIDHIVERARGGTHHPDLLVAISRRFHTLRHRNGWALSLSPATGMLTIARGRRRFHSLPRGARLARPPDPAWSVP